MDKVIIRQSKDVVGISDDPRGFARYCYDNNLRIVRLLYSYASKEFLERTTQATQDELVEALLVELDEDSQTLNLN